MDCIRINNPIERQFTKVPNSLWALPVSVTAKAIFAYLLSHRDGSTVRVALIEQTLRIGRDKRKSAMRELEEFKLIRREIARVRSTGRIVTRSLVIDTTPLLRRLLDDIDAENPSFDLPPENQAIGAENHLAPDLPAVGKHVAVATETRRNRGGKPVALNKTNTNTKKASPDLDLNVKGADVLAASLTSFLRSRVLAGHSVQLADGSKLVAGSPLCEAVQRSLRNSKSKGGVTRQSSEQRVAKGDANKSRGERSSKASGNTA